MSVQNVPVVEDPSFAPLGPSIADLGTAYRQADVTITEVVEGVLIRIAERGDDGTWITVADRFDLLAQARRLESDPGAAELPLYGIPFGVKDSIDVAGWPDNAGLP